MPAAILTQPDATGDDAIRRANQEAIARACARGDAWMSRWIREGVLVDAGTAARAWNTSVQAVDAASKRGEIFAVWADGGPWYLRDVLKLDRSQLARINRTLGDADPSSKLLFFQRKHGALRGRVVAEAVADGDLDDILRLAMAWGRT